jgi:hypothetical protein
LKNAYEQEDKTTYSGKFTKRQKEFLDYQINRGKDGKPEDEKCGCD